MIVGRQRDLIAGVATNPQLHAERVPRLLGLICGIDDLGETAHRTIASVSMPHTYEVAPLFCFGDASDLGAWHNGYTPFIVIVNRVRAAFRW